MDYAAVPWYRSDSEYEAFRSDASDGEDFFPSYRDWRAAAIHHENRAEQNGIAIVRVSMRLHEFQEWSRASKHHNDAKGRSAFADQRAKMIVTSSYEPS